MTDGKLRVGHSPMWGGKLACQWAGGRISRASEWAELQSRPPAPQRKIERDSIWTEGRQRQTYGNGERYFCT